MSSSPAYRVSLVAAFTASAVALRALKHFAVGSLPLFNAPAVFTLVAASLFGYSVGSLVGLLSFAVSDAIFGFGYWTLFDGAIMAAVGAAAATIMRWPCSKLRVFAASLALTSIYDVASSVAFWLVPYGFDVRQAVAMALLGLFIPAGGGTLYAVGPVQELVTAAAVSAILPACSRALKGYVP